MDEQQRPTGSKMPLPLPIDILSRIFYICHGAGYRRTSGNFLTLSRTHNHYFHPLFYHTILFTGSNGWSIIDYFCGSSASPRIANAVNRLVLTGLPSTINPRYYEEHRCFPNLESIVFTRALVVEAALYSVLMSGRCPHYFIDFIHRCTLPSISSDFPESKYSVSICVALGAMPAAEDCLAFVGEGPWWRPYYIGNGHSDRLTLTPRELALIALDFLIHIHKGANIGSVHYHDSPLVQLPSYPEARAKHISLSDDVCSYNRYKEYEIQSVRFGYYRDIWNDTKYDIRGPDTKLREQLGLLRQQGAPSIFIEKFWLDGSPGWRSRLMVEEGWKREDKDDKDTEPSVGERWRHGESRLVLDDGIGRRQKCGCTCDGIGGTIPHVPCAYGL